MTLRFCMYRCACNISWEHSMSERPNLHHVTLRLCCTVRRCTHYKIGVYRALTTTVRKESVRRNFLHVRTALLHRWVITQC